MAVLVHWTDALPVPLASKAREPLRWPFAAQRISRAQVVVRLACVAHPVSEVCEELQVFVVARVVFWVSRQYLPPNPCPGLLVAWLSVGVEPAAEWVKVQLERVHSQLSPGRVF